jgi:hypothetical protein
MKILGSMLITDTRAKLVKPGEVWHIPHNHLRRGMLTNARIGDLIWIKEAYCEVKSTRASPVGVHEMVPGMGPLHVKIPLHLQRLMGQGFLKFRFHKAKTMVRADSRRTIQIEQLADDHIVCRVIDGNAAEIAAKKGKQ